jgi:hypothetical protein
MLEVSRDAAAAGEEHLFNCAAELSKYALSVQRPLVLAAIYISRVGAVDSVIAAVLTQI